MRGTLFLQWIRRHHAVDNLEGTMKTVDFYFDFGSPNAYLAHKLIPKIEERTGAQFIYIPVLLGGIFKLTNNQSPAIQFKGVKNKREYIQHENQRFIARHSIPFQRNPFFPISTVVVMRGALVASHGGYLAKYVDTIFRHMWEAPKKMDDAAVIERVLDQAGLEGKRIVDMAGQQGIKDELTVDTQAAVDRGVFGCPTFFVGEEMFFGKDRLWQVEEEISRK